MNDLAAKILKATKALVRIQGRDAAYIEMIATDEFSFQYLSSYCEGEGSKVALSLAVPVRSEPYVSSSLLPFFDNLLFEGEQLRLIEKQYSLTRQSVVDRFRLLMLMGQTTLSVVSVLPFVDGEIYEFSHELETLDAPRELYGVQAAYKDACPICLLVSSKPHSSCVKALWGTTKEIQIEAFADEPQNIFKAIVLGQSLSGAQKKALFGLNRSGILRRSESPTHILKPEGEFEEMPANEHLTMAAARFLNFKVPASGLFRVEGIPGFLYVTRRFDRGPAGQVWAFEDMAQLSQELAEDKDRASMELVAETIEKFASSPAIEFADFFRRTLFCFLTGNGDMHLKNWGLLYDLNLSLRKLAPVYDYLNVRASFPQEQVEMILPIGGKSRQLTRDDFYKFGLDVLRLNRAYIDKTFQSLATWVDCLSEFAERSALSRGRKERYLRVVQERYARLHGED